MAGYAILDVRRVVRPVKGSVMRPRAWHPPILLSPTEAGVVRRKHWRAVDIDAVDVDSEQIANRVLILGAVQAPEGVGASGIGL